MESLLPGHAETASHLAARLRRHAERGALVAAVVVGDIDAFHHFPAGHLEQVLRRAVLAARLSRRRFAPYGVELREFLAVLLRQVGHRLYAGDVLFIEPLRYLRCREFRHFQFFDNCLQFLDSHTQQGLFV